MGTPTAAPGVPWEVGGAGGAGGPEGPSILGASCKGSRVPQNAGGSRSIQYTA